MLKRLELLKNGDFSLPESDSEFSWGYTKVKLYKKMVILISDQPKLNQIFWEDNLEQRIEINNNTNYTLTFISKLSEVNSHSTWRSDKLGEQNIQMSSKKSLTANWQEYVMF